MTIEIHDAEVERIVNDAVVSGAYGSPEEVVVKAVSDWYERQPGVPKGTLLEFFRESPLVGLELKIERTKDVDRDVPL